MTFHISYSQHCKELLQNGKTFKDINNMCFLNYRKFTIHSFVCQCTQQKMLKGTKHSSRIPLAMQPQKHVAICYHSKEKKKILNWSWKPVNVIVSIVSHLNLTYLIFKISLQIEDIQLKVNIASLLTVSLFNLNLSTLRIYQKAKT